MSQIFYVDRTRKTFENYSYFNELLDLHIYDVNLRKFRFSDSPFSCFRTLHSHYSVFLDKRYNDLFRLKDTHKCNYVVVLTGDLSYDKDCKIANVHIAKIDSTSYLIVRQWQ